MFRASLCPSSGEQRPCYCIWCVVLVLLGVAGSGCGALSCRMWSLWRFLFNSSPSWSIFIQLERSPLLCLYWRISCLLSILKAFEKKVAFRNRNLFPFSSTEMCLQRCRLVCVITRWSPWASPVTENVRVFCPIFRAVTKIQEQVLVFFCVSSSRRFGRSCYLHIQVDWIAPSVSSGPHNIHRLFLLYSENLYNTNEPYNSVDLVTSLQASKEW